MRPVTVSTSRVISKNYDLGSRRVASVGEPIIGVRNYTATDVVVEAVALQDFRQICSVPRGLDQAQELSFTADQEAYASGPSDESEIAPATKVDMAAIEGGAAEASASAPLAQHSADAYAEGETSQGTPVVAGSESEETAPRRSLLDRFHRLLTGDDASTPAPAAQVEASAGGSSAQAAATGMDDEVAMTVREDGGDAGVGASVQVSADAGTAEAQAPAVAHSPDTEFRLYDDTDLEARRENVTPSFAGLGDEEMEKLYCKRGLLSYVLAASGERFAIAGQFVEAGKTYYLVQLPVRGGDLFLAVDDSGRLKPERYVAWHDEDDTRKTSLGIPIEYLSVKYPLAPEKPLFFFDHRESVVAGGTSQNFDLIYEGTSYDHRGMVYHMRYREYDRVRPNEPIYVQDLAYSGHTSTVDVLGLRIRVHDVSDQQIIYTVQND